MPARRRPAPTPPPAARPIGRPPGSHASRRAPIATWPCAPTPARCGTRRSRRSCCARGCRTDRACTCRRRTPGTPGTMATERGTGIRSHYEQWMSEDSLLGPQGEYFEGSCFANYGYWETDTKGAREACENLMEKLLAMVPDKSGTILDVACGVGAATRHLLRHYAPERITAVDFAEKNLETARRFTPGCTFRQMDATRLDFPSETFDTVICVEAAFHFQPRSRFLQEAWRV